MSIFKLRSLILLAGGLVILVSMLLYDSLVMKTSHYQLAVIPHFMILPGKVSDFYAFLKNQYFAEEMPDQIVLLSPNHFFTQQKKVEGICTPQSIKFKNQTVNVISLEDPRIEC